MGWVKMFNQEDFAVFDDLTLAGRLAKVRSVIDPKFEALAPAIIETMGQTKPVYGHVAKHLRRFKNPPMNTWIAFSGNPRGYKMAPHIMLGFWDDRLFIWLAVLAEAKERQRLTPVLAGMLPQFTTLGADYEISQNHMAKPVADLTLRNLEKQLEHYQTVKQADFLVGRQWFKNDPIFDDPDQLRATLLQTFAELAPFYETLNL